MAIIRRHRDSYLAYCDGVVVARSVCPYVIRVHPVKTVGGKEMPFGRDIWAPNGREDLGNGIGDRNPGRNLHCKLRPDRYSGIVPETTAQSFTHDKFGTVCRKMNFFLHQNVQQKLLSTSQCEKNGANV